MDAKFECVFQKKGRPEVRGVVLLGVKPGATEQSVMNDMKLGRAVAARKFKRLNELHPCVKVRCEFIELVP